MRDRPRARVHLRAGRVGVERQQGWPDTVTRELCAGQVYADYGGLREARGVPTAPATRVGGRWTTGHPTTHRWVQHY